MLGFIIRIYHDARFFYKNISRWSVFWISNSLNFCNQQGARSNELCILYYKRYNYIRQRTRFSRCCIGHRMLLSSTYVTAPTFLTHITSEPRHNLRCYNWTSFYFRFEKGVAFYISRSEPLTFFTLNNPPISPPMMTVHSNSHQTV